MTTLWLDEGIVAKVSTLVYQHGGLLVREKKLAVFPGKVPSAFFSAVTKYLVGEPTVHTKQREVGNVLTCIGYSAEKKYLSVFGLEIVSYHKLGRFSAQSYWTNTYYRVSKDRLGVDVMSFSGRVKRFYTLHAFLWDQMHQIHDCKEHNDLLKSCFRDSPDLGFADLCDSTAAINERVRQAIKDMGYSGKVDWSNVSQPAIISFLHLVLQSYHGQWDAEARKAFIVGLLGKDAEPYVSTLWKQFITHVRLEFSEYGMSILYTVRFIRRAKVAKYLPLFGCDIHKISLLLRILQVERTNNHSPKYYRDYMVKACVGIVNGLKSVGPWPTRHYTDLPLFAQEIRYYSETDTSSVYSSITYLKGRLEILVDIANSRTNIISLLSKGYRAPGARSYYDVKRLFMHCRSARELHDRLSVMYNALHAEGRAKPKKYKLSATVQKYAGLVMEKLLCAYTSIPGFAQVTSITLPVTNYQVFEWGQAQGHCIATYASRHGRECLLFEVYQGEHRSHLMMDLNGGVVQWYGKYNSAVHASAAAGQYLRAELEAVYGGQFLTTRVIDQQGNQEDLIDDVF